VQHDRVAILEAVHTCPAAQKILEQRARDKVELPTFWFTTRKRCHPHPELRIFPVDATLEKRVADLLAQVRPTEIELPNVYNSIRKHTQDYLRCGDEIPSEIADRLKRMYLAALTSPKYAEQTAGFLATLDNAQLARVGVEPQMLEEVLRPKEKFYTARALITGIINGDVTDKNMFAEVARICESVLSDPTLT
jgi:hypothetical protein